MFTYFYTLSNVPIELDAASIQAWLIYRAMKEEAA